MNGKTRTERKGSRDRGIKGSRSRPRRSRLDPSIPRSLDPSGRPAFTLVEIIVVIIILGVLATLIAPRLIGRVGQAKTSTAQANAAAVAGAMSTFMLDTGRIPEGATVEVLWTKPAEVDDAAWKGPYVSNAEALKDPWGRMFVLVVPGEKNVDFDIVSYGADGKPGGTGEDEDVRKP